MTSATAYDLPSKHSADCDTAVSTEREINQTMDWPEPGELPGILPDVPTLDPALIPEAFRPWLVDVAQRMTCPLEYPAVGAMVALSAVVGRQVGIRPQRCDDWSVVPNLWGAIIGRPGLLKSQEVA